ncbi:hypothetical protein [uncultured Marivita sp.]|uniref:hypothetical protein n=1 Tax=uncultured Marivita sp. TaxID=888080 RepID=UPI0026062289|nr:hypothetical protein [uncultured Marivita sp.]
MVLVNITRWPAILVFLLAGSATAFFAFVTFNLFKHAMASVRFVREFGWDAILHGALWQVGELLIWGGAGLFFWLTFKTCEHELVNRYFAWANKNYNDRNVVPKNGNGADPKP